LLHPSTPPPMSGQHQHSSNAGGHPRVVEEGNHSQTPEVRSQPRWASNRSRMQSDLYAAFFELVGTAAFVMFALGGIQSTAFNQVPTGVTSIDQLWYISASMSFSLLFTVWLFARVTGGVFNPNVSLALLLTGVITPARFVFYCIAQLIGAVVGAGLVEVLLPGSLIGNTVPAQDVSSVQAVFIEAFITAALCFAVLMFAVEKHPGNSLAPIGIGFTLFACHLWAVPYTGAGMNTARSFGPAVIAGFGSRHWVYWVGPGLGSVIAAGLHKVLKMLEYESLHPSA